MQDSQGSPEQPKPKPTVKCKDCGFLAFKYLKSGKLTGVDAPFREKPNMNERGRFRRFSGRPVCFVAATDMDEEIGMSGPKDEIAIPEVISKERECGGYTSVIHGLSPREHLQMQLLEEQRKREDERDRLQREWQERKERKDRKMARERDKSQELLQKSLVDHQIIYQAVACVIQAIVSIFAALIAAFGLAVVAYFMDHFSRPGSSLDGQGNAAAVATSPPLPATTPTPLQSQSKPPAKPTE